MQHRFRHILIRRCFTTGVMNLREVRYSLCLRIQMNVLEVHS